MDSQTQKSSVTVIDCDVAASQLKRRLPYHWDLNAYRGCSHGCRYCYAIYSHQYMGSADFYGDIYAKGNIAERLERQLAAPGWNREVINLGGVTDNYQPAEADLQLMPDILRLLIRYRTPAIISTKSDLVLRDYDLIDQLSRVAWVNVAASIVTTDEALRQKLEPGSAPAARRFAVLEAFAKTNATTGLHCMPIIPWLTDGDENFDDLFGRAAACGVSYALPGTLYLRGKTKPVFLDFIAREFPEKYPALAALYQKGGADKAYKDDMYKRLNFYRSKHGLSGSYTAPMRQKMAQLAACEEPEAQQTSFL